MSDREDFVAARQARWDQLERLLSRPRRSAESWSRLAELYRSVAADLARARSTGQPRDVVRYLEQLAARGHSTLYGRHRTGGSRGILQLVMADFPAELRRSWRFFALASLLFYLPFVVGAVGALVDTDFALQVLPQSTLAQMEQAYSGEGVGRDANQDAMMAGFYVRNNVGIALRCFATGIFFGLGSVYVLVYNGLVMGVIEGYLWSVGAGWNLLDFTAGHSAWELTGIVVAGTAGLRLGWALVVTDGLTRGGSLKRAGPTLFRLVVGAMAMLFMAAAIEGFWSASPLPLVVKIGFGLVQIVLIALWLAFGGYREELP